MTRLRLAGKLTSSVLFVASVLALLTVGSATAATLPGSAAMITAIQGPNAGGAQYEQPIAFGGSLFYGGKDVDHGPGLVRSDGTAAGTTLLAPTAGTSDPPYGLVVAGAHLFFFTSDSEGRTHLWVSDGTAAGTMDIATAPASGYFNSDAVALGSDLYFVGSDADHGYELWRSDGTAPGTGRLTDIASGPADSSPQFLTPFDGKLYFSADDGTHGRELWSADAGGATLASDINSTGSASSNPHDLTVADGQLWFGATGPDGDELYHTVSGGTTTEFQNINAATASSSPMHLAAVGTTLFFTADDGSGHGRQLFTRAQSAGTASLVKDVSTSSEDITETSAVGGNLYFTLGAAGYDHPTQLWISNGTNGGTTSLADFDDDNPTNGYYNDVYVGPVTGVGGGVTGVFPAHTAAAGTELWQTDGTAGGTKLLSDIWAGTGDGSPARATVFGGRAYFSADDRTHGRELWRSDNTPSGTMLVTDLNTANAGVQPRFLAGIGDQLFFSANALTTGDEPWRSDGTAAGTVGLGETIPGPVPDAPGKQPQNSDPGAPPSYYTSAEHGVVFAADEPDHGRELWRIGPSGPELLQDIVPGTGSSYPANFASVGGRAFFVAADSTSASNLWRTDGTSAGTVKVAKVSSCGNNCGFPGVITLGDKLLYVNIAGGADRGLWRIGPGEDGPGTRIADVDVYQYQYFLTTYGGNAYFVGNNGTWGLYRTDGTAAGTTRLADLPPQFGQPFKAGAAGVFFDVDDNTKRWDWRYNPADGSTAAVTPPLERYDPVYEPYGDGLLFPNQDSEHGMELWIWDAAGGARLLKDINPGTAGSWPNSFVHHDGNVFFGADRPGARPLWQTDGTSDGTVLVPGTESGGVDDDLEAQSVGGILYFTHDDPVNGEQVWRFPAPPASDGNSAPPPPTPITNPPKTNPPKTNPLPAISGLKIKPSAFVAAKTGPSALKAAKRGAIVSYRVSMAAKVRFTVKRITTGRRVGKRCVKTTRANRSKRHCTRLVAVKGSFSRTLKKVGSDRFRFTGRIGKRTLTPGHYQLCARPAAGKQTGKTKTVKFTVKRARRR